MAAPLRQSGKFESGKLMLFFGARTKEELPYFGPLQNLPKDFIDINFAFSRTPGAPKRYVQDLMRERAADLARCWPTPTPTSTSAASRPWKKAWCWHCTMWPKGRPVLGSDRPCPAT
jgi:hypothetical protein